MGWGALMSRPYFTRGEQMKLAAVAVLMFILLATAASQSSQKSQISTLNPVREGPLNMQVIGDGYVYAKGHWVSTDANHALPVVGQGCSAIRRR